MLHKRVAPIPQQGCNGYYMVTRRESKAKANLPQAGNAELKKSKRRQVR